MAVKKSQMNLKHRYQWGNDIPLSTPFVIYLEPSGYCNLKCKFCPYTIHADETKRSLMIPETVVKLVKDLQLFPEKLKLVRICGNGEPLLNKNLASMVKLIKKSNVTDKIQLITNGTLLYLHDIKELVTYIDMIVISIEGLTSEDYLNISGAKIDYEKFIKYLKILYYNKQKCNIHIKINNLAVDTEEKKTKFYNQFDSICDEIFIENVIPQYPQLEYYSESSFRFNTDTKIQNKIICPQIFKSLQVQSDGEVVPCCVDWKRLNLLGNIKDTSLLDIWNGKLLNQLRETHLCGHRFNINPCKDCLMNEYSDVDNIDHLLKDAI